MLPVLHPLLQILACSRGVASPCRGIGSRLRELSVVLVLDNFRMLRLVNAIAFFYR